MAYWSCYRDVTAAGAPRAAPRSGLLRRVWDALYESRERAAERDIAGFLARSGGRFTDEIERRITQRFCDGDSRFRR